MANGPQTSKAFETMLKYGNFKHLPVSFLQVFESKVTMTTKPTLGPAE